MKLRAKLQKKSLSKSFHMMPAEGKFLMEPVTKPTSVETSKPTSASHLQTASTSQSHLIFTPTTKPISWNWPKSLKFTNFTPNWSKWVKTLKKSQKTNNSKNKDKSSILKSSLVTKTPSNISQLVNWSSSFWSLLVNCTSSSPCSTKAEEVTCQYDTLIDLMWF